MNIFRKKHQGSPKSGNPSPPAPVAEEPENFFKELDIQFLIHELKDPIAIIETGIRTLIDRPEKYGPLTEKQQKTLKRTLRNSKKAREMLHNLLEIGRAESSCFTPNRFIPAEKTCNALYEALEIMAWQVFEQLDAFDAESDSLAFLEQEGISVIVEPDAKEMVMVQDETKFGQIVGNLIKNALHHRKQKIAIRIRFDANRYVTEVADDGPGIDPEHHQTIFQRYTRLKECTLLPRTGHGLGLAGARILARNMGGDIEIDSREGEGTVFRLTLPIDSTQADVAK